MIVKCHHCGKKNRVPAAARGRPQCGNCHQPIAWIAEAGDADFAEVAEQAELPVLVDFWAPWCGPCRTVSPILEELASDHSGRLKLVKVDVDKSPALSERFGIRHIPSLMVLKEGKQVAFQPGAASKKQLREWLDQALRK